MQVLLSVALICITTFIGYKAGLGSKKREELFDDILHFIEFYRVNIDYFKFELGKTGERYEASTETVGSIVTTLSSDLPNDKKKTKLITLIKDTGISENETRSVVGFFQALGYCNSQNEREQADAYYRIFNGYKNKYSDKRIKNAGLFTKLGFFVGVALVIIIL